MSEQFAILLVEDSLDDVILLRRAFSRARVLNPLIRVEDGAQAIDYLCGNGIYGDREKYPLPFLILMDLMMPKVSGLEAIKWIRDRQEFARITIVALTGHDDFACIAEAHRQGADSYLVKPGGTEQFFEMLQRFQGYWLMTNRRADNAA
jgi:CheY-like chemotaxis protein